MTQGEFSVVHLSTGHLGGAGLAADLPQRHGADRGGLGGR